MNQETTVKSNNSHSIPMGYIFWIFGFMGAHRFYYGKKISGCIWFFTFGLFGIGWLIDLFLIPGMDKDADFKYKEGPVEYTVAWILLTFLGAFGAHRFYMKKWISAILYLITGGVFAMGILYDYLTLNEQINEVNSSGN